MGAFTLSAPPNHNPVDSCIAKVCPFLNYVNTAWPHLPVWSGDRHWSRMTRWRRQCHLGTPGPLFANILLLICPGKGSTMRWELGETSLTLSCSNFERLTDSFSMGITCRRGQLVTSTTACWGLSVTVVNNSLKLQIMPTLLFVLKSKFQNPHFPTGSKIIVCIVVYL